MQENIKKYTCFFLKPDIYVRQINKHLLLYHTSSGKHLITTSPLLRQIVEETYQPENMGATLINFHGLETEERQLLEFLVSNGFAAMKEKRTDGVRPIVLLPILNLQRDVERLMMSENSSIGKDVMGYLTELIIKLKGEYVSMLPEDIESLLQQIRYSSVQNIHIKGEVQLSHMDVLQKYEFHYHFWNDYCHACSDDIRANINRYSKLFASSVFHIEVSFPADVVRLKECLERLNDNVIVEFSIKSAEEYMHAEHIVEELVIDYYRFIPLYDGSNLDFFKDFVFMTKADLFASPISHQRIFCNQKLNANYFGKLYVEADGQVKASPLTEPVGNIHNDSIVKILYQELMANTAWRRTRSMYPCRECLFQYLCPPPSEFEQLLNMPNLCHIHKGEKPKDPNS